MCGQMFSFLLSICLGVKVPMWLLNVNFFFLSTVFQSNFTILQSQQQCMSLSFSTSLPTFVCTLCLFYFSHPSVCEMLSDCGLICIFLITKDVEHLFICSFWPCQVWGAQAGIPGHDSIYNTAVDSFPSSLKRYIFYQGRSKYLGSFCNKCGFYLRAQQKKLTKNF